MIRVERMASLGKLAAVVAHEINNPLASVVTYSKVLLRRGRPRPARPRRRSENLQILEAIASESARCGEIVSNLLLFARRTGSRMEPTDVNQLVDRALFLIKHKMDLAQVTADLALAADLPHVMCDPAQVEQAMLALCINAVEAMPNGGTLTVRTTADRDGRGPDRGRGHRGRDGRGGASAHLRAVLHDQGRGRGARGSASASRLSTGSCSDTMGRSTSRACPGRGPASP